MNTQPNTVLTVEDIEKCRSLNSEHTPVLINALCDLALKGLEFGAFDEAIEAVVQDAEGLIQQLPPEHQGRNTWLLNYGRSDEAVVLRKKRDLAWDEETKSAQTEPSGEHYPDMSIDELMTKTPAQVAEYFIPSVFHGAGGCTKRVYTATLLRKAETCPPAPTDPAELRKDAEYHAKLLEPSPSSSVQEELDAGLNLVDGLNDTNFVQRNPAPHAAAHVNTAFGSFTIPSVPSPSGSEYIESDRSEADFQEPSGSVDFPSGAIVNGQTCIDQLENQYSFECEAGPLALCQDWVTLKQCFEHLVTETHRLHHPSGSVREAGQSKLVYDKAKRTIMAVDPSGNQKPFVPSGSVEGLIQELLDEVPGSRKEAAEALKRLIEEVSRLKDRQQRTYNEAVKAYDQRDALSAQVQTLRKALRLAEPILQERAENIVYGHEMLSGIRAGKLDDEGQRLLEPVKTALEAARVALGDG